MLITIDRQIQCLKDELRRRKFTFPKLVESGKMQQDTSLLELATMQAAMETLTALRGLVSVASPSKTQRVEGFPPSQPLQWRGFEHPPLASFPSQGIVCKTDTPT